MYLCITIAARDRQDFQSCVALWYIQQILLKVSKADQR